ncbi:L-amino acid N-acyltransferase MnaT-like [Babylonia areolata]
MLSTSYGTMGMLYVNPDFRRKGYAKVIVSQLTQKKFDRGEDVYVVVEESNSASQHLHESLGFTIVPAGTLVWLRCGPNPFDKMTC